ncbi:MAG: phytoene dehydrogenase [Rhodothermaceae bacterium]|nr:MAG: phytoene dehydrogenase [Rhodothermaceae bacterium]
MGGRAYQFIEKGYVFDMGPSLITAPEIIEDVFRAAGRSRADYLDLIPLDPYYRVFFHDGTWIDYTGDPERMKAQMRRFNEEDAERYDAFMEAVRPVYEAVITDRLGARPFDTVRSMLDFAPRAIKLKAFLPVATFARRYFKDFRHHFLFSFHPLFIGGNPFRSPSVYIMIPYLEREQGVWFTKGGMYEVVKAFERLFREQGGVVHTGTEVSEIRVEGGRATGVMAGGTFFPADLVVSNADVAHTYRHLIAPEHRRKWTDRRVEKMDYTMSCFLLYLGVRKKYPQLEHHTLILTKRYKELLRDIFDRKVLPDDFSMYLHAPTKTDPSMAPEGGESLYVLVPVANLASGIDWRQEAGPFADRVLDFLEAWGLEGLRAHTEVMRIFTPEDFKHELNAHLGNAFGLEPKLSQTAYFRPHNRSEDVPNLYFVGAGTHPGAGVPGVLLSAEATEYSIRRDLGLGHATGDGSAGTRFAAPALQEA